MEGRVAIIGGGPAGLAAGRALKAFGIPFVIFERNADFGGLWNRDRKLSPIYDSAHFISSRTMSAFDGFPMPEDWPDYPRHDLILDYVRSFARAFGLYDHGRFGAEATRAARRGGAEHDKLRAEVAKGGYDLSGGLRMVASERHEAYVSRDAYAAALRKLRRRMGWPKTEDAHAARSAA